MSTRYPGKRTELLRLFDPADMAILDVGCGEGGLAEHLRTGGARLLVGVELVAAQADVARATYDEVIAGSIESALTDGSLDGREFDLIICSDVLEHLVDPWTALASLRTHLAPGGKVLISIPNVANLSVVLQLFVRRDWRYEPSGIFDSTHLRWFGRGTLEQMVEGAGLRVTCWAGLIRAGVGPLRVRRLVDDLGRWPALAIFSFHILAE